MLGEWPEDVKEPVLDKDLEVAQMVEELTGDRPKPTKASTRLEKYI